ncbi:MAG TPA: hypothetical protein P5262_03010 [Candidatus Moranbacteria bacterium]|nr:hypothetical protein [Candidatus Moranbacteria bacterium]
MRILKTRRAMLFSMIAMVALLAGGVKSALALSGTYNFASSGNYYTSYGPSEYWHTTTNAGYCGHISGSCSPNSMRWTYTNGCFPSNQAKWDNPNSAQDGAHRVFIPSVNATTTNAPYTITYDGASSSVWYINQNAYYDTWIWTGDYYDIRNTWLSDATCEGGSPKIGFDEVRITY